MKKLLSVILIIAMVFGLCSCGEQVFTGEKLTVTFKGVGTKKLSVSVSYPNLASYTRTALVPEGELTEPVYTSNLVKAKGDVVTYKLVGKAEGTASFTAAFTSADGEEMSCSMVVHVSDKKKVTFDNLSFGDSPQYTKLGQSAYVTYFEGSSKQISLAAEGGIWKIGIYEEDELSVEENESTLDAESGEIYYNFLVTGLKPCETSVQFINREIQKQLIFKFAVTEVQDPDVEGATKLVLTLIDYFADAFTEEDDILYQKRKKATEEEIKKIFGDDVYIPDGDGFYIDDSAFVNDNKESIYDKNGEIDPDQCDGVDMVCMIDGNVLDYVITKTKTFEQACAELEEADAIPQVKLDLTIGGNPVRYYYTTFGFSEAVWSQGQYTSILVFMAEDQTDKGNRKVLYTFLGCADEYHE